MSSRRVVVTGIGLVSSLGLDWKTNWRALLEGKSGIRRITHFDTTEFPSQIAGTIDEELLDQILPRSDRRRIDRFVQYGRIAGRDAIADAHWTSEDISDRIGVAVGSGIGGLYGIEAAHEQFLARGPRRVSPYLIPSVILNALASQLALEFCLRGPNIAISTACASGLHNLAMATRLIQTGDADGMLAGGAEAASTPLSLAGFSALRALSITNGRPTQASRPFDRARNGFVLADGAGILMLESYELASTRKAPMYAEIVGIGLSCDAHHLTAPDPSGSGSMRAMARALQEAQIQPQEVGYINAHATSTPIGDRAELTAIRAIFPPKSCPHLAISSTKSMTGHLLGAAGSFEAGVTCLALQYGQLPPTINLDDPDELAQGMNLVPHRAQPHKMQYALCNSFGFGGSNVSIVLKRMDHL